MAPKESKISIQVAASTTRDIKFTIPETIEIIRKPGSATSHHDVMAVHTIGLLTIYGIKKHGKNYL